MNKRETRLLRRAIAVRALRRTQRLNRTDARRRVFRPSSDAELRQRRTTALLQEQTAARLGLIRQEASR